MTVPSFDGIIKVTGLAYVAFKAPDLACMAGFLSDFGFKSTEVTDGALYAYGHGGRPYLHRTSVGEPAFSALGFSTADVADVHALAQATGLPVTQLATPGGGVCVRMTDPDGYVVEVVGGQQAVRGEPLQGAQPWNRFTEYARVSTLKRLRGTGAHIHRLGHCVLRVTDFRRSEAWYKSHFGLITSDEIEIAPGETLGAFMRCDLGDEPADHHTVFLAQAPKPSFSHAAYEVLDMDDLMAGHDQLTRAGHRSFWGVGRHVLGSQVFDYWLDPWGNQLELWTDGDLLTRADGSRIAPVAELRRVQWGVGFPDAPAPATPQER